MNTNTEQLTSDSEVSLSNLLAQQKGDIDYSKFDRECVNICKAINRLEDIITVCSCCGHGKDNFRIWLKVNDLSELPIMLYYLDKCHVGFSWDCFATTDCGMSPVTFRIESQCKGDEAYKQAEIIANKINEYLDNYVKEES